MESKETLITYYGALDYRNFNKPAYPTKGMEWSLRYELITDNTFSYKSTTPVSAFYGHWESALSFSDRFTLLPSLAGRILVYDKLPFSKINVIGGEANGIYMPHQLAFSGVGKMEMAAPTSAVARLKAQQRIGRAFYALLALNYAYMDDIMGIHTIEDKHLYGGSIGGGYNSFLGPAELTIGYSNRTSKARAYLNFGLYF